MSDHDISMGYIENRPFERIEVGGHADILVAPDLEAGTMIVEQLMYVAGAKAVLFHEAMQT